MSNLNLSSIDTAKQANNSQRDFGVLKLVVLHHQLFEKSNKIAYLIYKLKNATHFFLIAISSYTQNNLLKRKTELIKNNVIETNIHYCVMSKG